MRKLTKQEELLISEFQHHTLNFYLFLDRIQNFVKPIYDGCYATGSQYDLQRIIKNLKHEDRKPLIDFNNFLPKHFIEFFKSDVIKETNSFLRNIETINQEAKNNFLISDKLSEIIEKHCSYFMEKFKKTEIKTLDTLYEGANYLNQEKFNELKQDFRDYISSDI